MTVVMTVMTNAEMACGGRNHFSLWWNEAVEMVQIKVVMVLGEMRCVICILYKTQVALMEA